jgi:hypothetical protein
MPRVTRKQNNNTTMFETKVDTQQRVSRAPTHTNMQAQWDAQTRAINRQ